MCCTVFLWTKKIITREKKYAFEETYCCIVWWKDVAFKWMLLNWNNCTALCVLTSQHTLSAVILQWKIYSNLPRSRSLAMLAYVMYTQDPLRCASSYLICIRIVRYLLICRNWELFTHHTVYDSFFVSAVHVCMSRSHFLYYRSIHIHTKKMPFISRKSHSLNALHSL